MSFTQPVLYTKLTELTDIIANDSAVELAQNELDLKMFIKLPKLNDSSITILEGDYRGYNDSILNIGGRTTNHIEINKNMEDMIIHENIQDDPNDSEKKISTITWSKAQDFSNLKLVTPLQLLMLNTHESYPFADRLIEYLLDNVVSPEDELHDNIARVKTIADLNGVTLNADKFWEDKLRAVIYEDLVSRPNINQHDLLGYLDRYAEQNYVYYTNARNNESISSARIDIYNEEK